MKNSLAPRRERTKKKSSLSRALRRREKLKTKPFPGIVKFMNTQEKFKFEIPRNFEGEFEFTTVGHVTRLLEKSLVVEGTFVIYDRYGVPRDQDHQILLAKNERIQAQWFPKDTPQERLSQKREVPFLMPYFNIGDPSKFGNAKGSIFYSESGLRKLCINRNLSIEGSRQDLEKRLIDHELL